MGIVYVSSKNKNTLIKFEQKQPENQNPQKSLVQKFMWKMQEECMKIENKWKRKGIYVLPTLEDKIPWRFEEENDKKVLDWIGQERKGRKEEKTFWNCEEHVMLKGFYFSFFLKLDRSSADWVPIKPDRMDPLKPLKISIIRKIASTNRNLNKIDLIDQVPIEDQSNQPEAKFKKSRDFRLVEKHIRSIKILENWIFLKNCRRLCRIH